MTADKMGKERKFFNLKHYAASSRATEKNNKKS